MERIGQCHCGSLQSSTTGKADHRSQSSDKVRFDSTETEQHSAMAVLRFDCIEYPSASEISMAVRLRRRGAVQSRSPPINRSRIDCSSCCR